MNKKVFLLFGLLLFVAGVGTESAEIVFEDNFDSGLSQWVTAGQGSFTTSGGKLIVSSYGSGSGWHGPTINRGISVTKDEWKVSWIQSYSNTGSYALSQHNFGLNLSDGTYIMLLRSDSQASRLQISNLISINGTNEYNYYNVETYSVTDAEHIITSNSTHIKIYFDGTLRHTFASTAKPTAISANYNQFRSYNLTSVLNAESVTVTQTKQTNFSITAVSSWDNSTINTFNATVDGTTYTTTNGTIVTSILENSTSLYNVTVRAPDYFDYVVNDYNVSSKLQANLSGGSVLINSFETLDNTTVFEYNVTLSDGVTSETKSKGLFGGLLNFTGLKPNTNYTINAVSITPAGYNIDNFSYSHGSKENNDITLTGGYNHILNITATTPAGISDQKFSINLTALNFSYNLSSSTNNGLISFNLVNGSYNLTIFADSFETQSQVVVLNDSVNFSSYDFQIRAANSFNLSFYNETTNTLLDDVNITLQVISDSEARNYTISNGLQEVTLLTPDSYELVYWYNDEVIRRYYTTLTPQSYQEIDLFLVEPSVSAYYVPVAFNENGVPCQDNTISLLRYYIEDNSYKVVGMTKTNSLGQGVLRLVPNNVNYKLLFSGSCGTYTTPPTAFIDTTNAYTITSAQTTLTSLEAISGASANVSYVDATRTFVFDWTSDSNIITQGCLEITRLRAGSRGIIATECALGNTGSTLYTIPLNETNNTRYFAEGKLYTNTEYSNYLVGVASANFIQMFASFSAVAPIIAMILFSSIVLFFGTSAPNLVIGAVLSIAVFGMFNFLTLGASTLVSLVIFGGIILYRIRSA